MTDFLKLDSLLLRAVIHSEYTHMVNYFMESHSLTYSIVKFLSYQLLLSKYYAAIKLHMSSAH